MNKSFFKCAVGFILIAMNGSSAFATERNVETMFNFQTNLGVTEKHSLKINGSAVFVDGMQLSKTSLMLVSQELSVFLAVQSDILSEHQPCGAGTFSHGISLKGKESAEIGCISDKRFQVLFSAFTRLKQAALLPSG